MKIVVASDAFKGTLSIQEANDTIAQAIKEVLPNAFIEEVYIADGGEGTLEALAQCLDVAWVTCTSSDAWLRPIHSSYLMMEDGTALIELARPVGLAQLLEEEKNPLYTSTYGVGQLILDSLNQGAKQIILTIGGSATNEGGMGALSALGVRFLDEKKEEVVPIGKNLRNVKEIDFSQVDKRLYETPIQILCDVKNPLLGPNGATYTYGPQKGANEEMLKELEEGMEQYVSLFESMLNQSIRNLEGMGAAGGFSIGFVSLFHAKLVSGVETVMRLAHLEEKIRDADFVITGEGRIDAQSSQGKVLSGIGALCKKHEIPCVAFGGKVEGTSSLEGIQKLIQVSPMDESFEIIQQHAQEYLSLAVKNFFTDK